MNQTEELIKLAHQLTYHQLEQYNEMIFRLAQLSLDVDRSQLKKICQEIIAISPYNQFKEIFAYVLILSLIVVAFPDDLEIIEQLLEVFERLPEAEV